MQKIYGKPRKKLQSSMQRLPSRTLWKHSRAARKYYNVRCFRIHLKGTRRKQTPPAAQEPCTTPRTNKSTTSYDRHIKSGLQPPPTLVNIRHPAYHRHSPYPLTYQLIITTHPIRNISPPIDYRSVVPQSLTTPCNPLHSQLGLNSYSISASVSNRDGCTLALHTRTPNTLS